MKTVHYFSHDVNAYFDPKIRVIVSEFGVMAYGIFWVILEMLASQKDYRIKREGFSRILYPMVQGKPVWYNEEEGSYVDCEKNKISDEDAGNLSICLARVEAVLVAMFSTGLLLEDVDNCLYSNSLYERMERKEEISRKRQESGRLGGLAKAQSTLNVDPSKCLPLKEKKGKESKRKETVFIVPTQKQIDEFITANACKVDGVKFFNYYETNGWRVGRGKMKNWKSAIRYWHTSGKHINDIVKAPKMYKDPEWLNKGE